MSSKQMTITTCDVLGCTERIETEAGGTGLPAGWSHLELFLPLADPMILCPAHVELIMEILKPPVKAVRGKDKKPRSSSRCRARQGQGRASTLPDKEIITPEPTQGKKGNAAKSEGEYILTGLAGGEVQTPEQAAKARAAQHLECPGCKDYLKKECILDGTAAIHCWDVKGLLIL